MFDYVGIYFLIKSLTLILIGWTTLQGPSGPLAKDLLHQGLIIVVKYTNVLNNARLIT